MLIVEMVTWVDLKYENMINTRSTPSIRVDSEEDYVNDDEESTAI